MINNNYKYLNFLHLSFVVLIFLFVYFLRFDIVGHFPSENLNDLYEISTENINSPQFLNQKSNSKNFPEFNLENQLPSLFLNEIDKSPNILFDERRNKLNVIGPPHVKEMILLEKVITNDKANIQDQNDFFNSIKNIKSNGSNQIYYNNPITEKYWASKGSSVLHHWMHLLDTSSNHYGSLLRLISNFSNYFEKDGPTLEVKIIWIALFLIALLYSVIFLKFFNNNLVLAYPLLLIKIFYFQKIGLFVLLLGPGFHWLRDLVLLLTPIIFIWLINYYKIKTFNKELSLSPYLKILGAILILFLLFLSDQTFFWISIISIFIATIAININQIILFLKIYVVYLMLFIFIIAFTNYLFNILPLSNINYVINLLIDNNNLIPISKEYILFFIKFSALILMYVFYLLNFEKNNFYGFYFSIISLILILYVITMPDRFHMDKYISFIAPIFFYMLLSIKNIFYILCSQFPKFFKASIMDLGFFKRLSTSAYLIISFSLIILNLYQVYKHTKPNYSELSLYSMFDKKIYFNVKDIEINGNSIKANISDDLVNHLSSFPKDQKYDFIISPFDKYVSALYKKTNGFGNVDLVRSSDTSQKIKFFKSLIASKNFSIVILDEKILDLNNKYLWNGLNYLYLADAGKYDYKSQVRAANLAQYLLNSCEHLNMNEKWLTLKCF